jgi:photosystem II stability/assembly factor-like uncharacterized protein
MIAAWRRLMSRYARKWFAPVLGIVVLSLLAACTQRELWSDNAAPDQIPSFEQVSPPDLNAVIELPGGVLVAVGGKGAILRSNDKGGHWENVARGLTANNLQHIIAAQDKALVAVGDKGSIVRSRNGGAGWSLIAKTGTSLDLRKVVAVSPAVLVAVGDEGIVLRSGDAGDSWFPVYKHSTALLDVVATDSQHLAAVGEGGVILESANGGRSWTVVSNLTAQLSRLLVTHTGAVLAAGYEIRRADHIGAAWLQAKVPITSGDGAERMPFTQLIEAADGKLVALGPGRRIQYSLDDGRTWQASTAAAEINGADLILRAAGGALAAVIDTQAVRSTDGGVSWSPAHAPRAATLRAGLTLADGTLLAVGRGGTVLRSDDGGANWTSMPGSGTTETLLDLDAGVNDVLVAVGERGAILRSTDGGLSWAGVPEGGRDARLRRVLSQQAGPWIAVGQDTILQSDTGESWEPAETPPINDELSDLIAVPVAGTTDALAVVGGAGEIGSILYSANGGRSWSAPPARPKKALRSITLHRGMLIAVGDNGTILRSNNLGKDWQPAAASGTEQTLTSVTSSGNVLVACGEDGTIVRSTDGLGAVWSGVEYQTPAYVTLDAIVAGRAGTLLAFGSRFGEDGVRMLRSTDRGATWAAVSSPALARTTLSRIVTQADGVMIGLGRHILRSVDDGASWSEVPDAGPPGALNDALTARDGRLVAVGGDGIVMRQTGQRAAPTIRRIVHSYTAAGIPMLKITLDDPAGLCPNAQCLRVWARSEVDNKSGRTGDRQPPPRLTASSGTQSDYQLEINSSLASTQNPHPLYVNLEVDVPGHHSVLRNSSGADFEVPNDPTPLYKNPYVQALAVLVGLVLLLLLIANLRPLWLLPLMKIQEDLSRHGVSGWSGHALTLVVKLVLPILSRQPRVLDAWVELHAERLAIAFDEAAKKVSDQSPYWALPVTGPDGAQFRPSLATMADFFKPKRVFMEIVGQGGAGKTRLALQICTWLTSNRLAVHPAAAVLVDEEFTDVLAIVSAKVTAALGNDAPVPAFLNMLLLRGRLWVFIDRVSERQQATRLAVSRIYESVSPKVVVCTSRQSIELSGGRKITLKPEPLAPETMLEFVLALLRENDARQLFPDPNQLVQVINDIAPHPTGPPDVPRVTPLLVTIIVAEAIEAARAHGTAALRTLPPSVPKIYFSYVLRLDETRQDRPEAPGITTAALVGRAATIIACTELGDDFRPKRVNDATVHQALMADPQIQASKVDFIDRFVQNGLLSRRIIGFESSVEYLLDPLAECLAAYALALQCGASLERWHALVQRIAGMGTGAQGFMAALRMNHEAYAKDFGFPSLAFPAVQ